jgi:HEAT repeat protein
MTELRALLAGGDRRSLGRVPEVVATVQASPALLDELVAAIGDADAVVRMRAADALEKVTAAHPEWLAPYAAQLLGPLAAIPQQEVRWHVAQLLPRLLLDDAQRQVATAILFGYLEDRSAIVRTCALDALARLAEGDPALQVRVTALLEAALRDGTPAERSRAQRVRAELARRTEAQR